MIKLRKDNLRHEDLASSLYLPAIEYLVKPGQDEKAFKVLEFIRKECQFEMNLVGTRVTWMLAAQAFLVSAFVLSLSKAIEDRSALMCTISCLICIVGLMIAWRTTHALRQAKTTIKLWHTRTRLLIEAAKRQDASAGPLAWHGAILGRWSDPDDTIHIESLKLSHVYLPMIFRVFWTIAMFVSVWVAYSNYHVRRRP